MANVIQRRQCKVLRITNKRRPISSDYYIHTHKLAMNTDAKYLGVTISSDLSWGKHTDNITKKANSTMPFLKRNIWSVPQTAKDMAYKTIVRPILEYASSTWALYTKRDNHKVEMVQRRAARFITTDYRHTSSVTSMLYQLGCDTLQRRRELARLTMMHRVVQQLVDIPTEPYLTPFHLLSSNPDIICRLPEQLLSEKNYAVEPALPVSCEPDNAEGFPGKVGHPHCYEMD